VVINVFNHCCFRIAKYFLGLLNFIKIVAAQRVNR